MGNSLLVHLAGSLPSVKSLNPEKLFGAKKLTKICKKIQKIDKNLFKKKGNGTGRGKKNSCVCLRLCARRCVSTSSPPTRTCSKCPCGCITRRWRPFSPTAHQYPFKRFSERHVAKCIAYWVYSTVEITHPIANIKENDYRMMIV